MRFQNLPASIECDFIIIICGFGIPMEWSSKTRDEDGKLSLTTMFHEVAANVPLRALLPKIFFRLPIPKYVYNIHSYNKSDIPNIHYPLHNIAEINSPTTDSSHFQLIISPSAQLNSTQLTSHEDCASSTKHTHNSRRSRAPRCRGAKRR